MKMHANFALTTPQHVTAKFPERRALRHLEVGKPSRLEAVAFAKILKPGGASGESACILTRERRSSAITFHLPIDVKSGRCVLVQRGNTQNRPYNSFH